jgi:uncharacterized protein (DUF58 family)
MRGLVQRARSAAAFMSSLPLLRALSRLGWLLSAAAVVFWVLAWRLGWEELAILAGICVLMVVVAQLFTIGRRAYVVVIELSPKRITAGERAGGRLVVKSATGRPQLPSRLELQVGAVRAAFQIPSLRGDAVHDELFTIPSERRGVVPVGPAMSVKGDPLGVCRLEKAWTGAEELFVHPRISPLDRLGSGFVKDLEGHTTNDLSPSDIAFHTLREYVPGDDRRHVHWKTSARIGSLMVRQYVDTRRSHLAVILSTSPDDYTDEDEFELAVSLAASLAVRTLRDEQAVSMVAGGRPVPSDNTQALLDGLARVEFGSADGDLHAGAIQANQSASAASIVALVVGSTIDLPEIRFATNRLVAQSRQVILRAHRGGDLGYRPIGSLAVINVPSLEEFAQGLWRATQV